MIKKQCPIGCGKGVGTFQIDFVLRGGYLMMGFFKFDPAGFENRYDLIADSLTFVVGCDLEIPGLVGMHLLCKRIPGQ